MSEQHQPRFDPELVRLILLDADSLPKNQTATGFTYPDKNEKDVTRHINLLIEEAFLNGFLIRDCTNFYRIAGLTEKGDTFVDAIKSDDVWNKAVKSLKESSFTLRALQSAVNQQLGI